MLRIAGAGIDRRQLGHLEDLGFDGAYEPVLFRERKIAARVHHDDARVGLDVREELDRRPDPRIGNRNPDQHHNGKQDRQPRMPDREADDAHVAALARHHVMIDDVRLADQGTEGWRKDERRYERGGEGRDQGDRHVFHELADNPRPEEERRECRNPGERRRDHRPRHAARREGIGLARLHALAHPPLGELRHDDGVVNQHADREDQREQDDDVHRQAEQVQAENAGQEGDRNGNADKDRGAPAESEQDDDEDEDDAGEHAVLQVGEKLADGLRLIVDEADLDLLRPVRLHRVHRRLHPIDRGNEVGAGSL